MLKSFDKKNLLRKLYLLRLSEEAIQKDYFNNEMKTPVHLAVGAEAIALGVLESLPSDSSVFATYRNHNIFLGLSEDTDSFFAELFGRSTGCAQGKAGSMHLSHPDKNLILTSAVVATTIPIAVGSALAHRYQGSEKLAVVFFGDGAIEEGVFSESLNFACLHNLKILFVCEDNELAIHTFKKDRHGFKSLEKIVQAYHAGYYESSGYHLEDVLETNQKAVQDIQKNSRPVVCKYNYFRFLQHVGTLEDFGDGYREKPENMIQNFDPIYRYEQQLLNEGESERSLQKIKQEVLQQIAQSLEKARNAPFAELSEVTKNVYIE